MASVPGSPLNLEGSRKEATLWVSQEGGGGNGRFRLLLSLPGQGTGCQESDCNLERGIDPGAGTRERPAILSYCGFKSDFFSKALFSHSVQGEEKRNQRGGEMGW